MPSEGAFSQRRQFDTPLRIASVGRVEHSQKGVLFLPEIVKGCLDAGVDVRLTVAGDGPDRDALQQRVDDLGLSDRIVLSGRLSEEKVYDLLLDSHVLLMPSFFEGWPLALQEAMACGCVPVASLLKGATDYTVIDGRTGFLAEVGQVKEFVSAIVKLHEDPPKWLELSTAAHETILTGYSDVYMTASYCRLISEALEGRYPLSRPRSSQPQVNRGLYTKGDYVPAWSRGTLRSIRLGLQKLLPGSRRHFQEDKSDLTPDDCSLCGR
jgi:glycosyltransferase involved in cell wall biosynthesis